MRVFAPYKAEREERLFFSSVRFATTKNIPLLKQMRASEAATLLSSGRTIYENRAIKAVVRANHPAIGVNFFISLSPSIGIKHAVTEEKAEQDKTHVVHQVTGVHHTF